MNELVEFAKDHPVITWLAAMLIVAVIATLCESMKSVISFLFDRKERVVMDNYEDEDEVIVSNCCCAPVKWTDICTECLEHCDPVVLGEE